MQKQKKIFSILPLALFTFLNQPTFATVTDAVKTEQTFNAEVTHFSQFIKDIFETKIHLSKDWNSNRATFSANAGSMSGRVIRVSGFDYRSNTLAAFRLGLCHETGHYLGGRPFLRLDPGSVENTVNRMELSAEGQADYFASYCLKKYYDYLKLNNPNSTNQASENSEKISAFCNDSKPTIQSQQKCEYIATAALDLINYLNAHYSRADQNNPPIQFDAYKDTQTSSHTLNGRREYPALNCRLKTYLAGTLCQNDDLPPNQFVCNSGEGSRPDCWFIP